MTSATGPRMRFAVWRRELTDGLIIRAGNQMLSKQASGADLERWTKRLRLPAYLVQDAARYSGISVQTVNNWQKAQGQYVPALANREKGASLSYLQLVELRFVAAMRKAGVPLRKIRAAREYLAQRFAADHPFATLRLKTNGQDILLDLEESEGHAFKGTVLVANKGGQYSWKAIIGDTFQEFDYEKDLAMRWHVAGRSSPVVIDPRVAFGAPTVSGVPTWALRGRWESGEPIDEIAEDFKLTKLEVRAAVEFEKLKGRQQRPPSTSRVH